MPKGQDGNNTQKKQKEKHQLEMAELVVEFCLVYKDGKVDLCMSLEVLKNDIYSELNKKTIIMGEIQ